MCLDDGSGRFTHVKISRYPLDREMGQGCTNAERMNFFTGASVCGCVSHGARFGSPFWGRDVLKMCGPQMGGARRRCGRCGETKASSCPAGNQTHTSVHPAGESLH